MNVPRWSGLTPRRSERVARSTCFTYRIYGEKPSKNAGTQHRSLGIRHFSSWLQFQGILGISRQERRGFAVHPGFVAGAIKRREGMSALAAGHFKDAFVFVAGRDDEALARAILERLEARHLVVA